MTTHALNAYEKLAPVFSEEVWFEGTTALLEGQAVCYNFDYGTDTEKDGRRGNKVEVPSTTNSQYFAGVCAEKHAASATGQLIRIYKPGSWCNVLSRANTTIGVGRLTFEITATVATNGSFAFEGMEGEGSCVPLQTIDRSTPGLCFAKLDSPGRPSGGFEQVQLVDQTAFVAMLHGTTGLIGAALSTNDATETFVVGTANGQRKRFVVITTEISTNDAVITVNEGRSAALDDASLETVIFAGASTCLGKSVTLEWQGGWMVVGASETMPALA
jgi:hypothetical protein